MKKYEVTWTLTENYRLLVEADNKKDAEGKADALIAGCDSGGLAPGTDYYVGSKWRVETKKR